MNSRARGGLSLGTSTILVTFVLLCITTFATMSLISASADHKLTQKQAEGAHEYYTADAAAEERLAEIYSVVSRALEASDTADGFFVQLSRGSGLWSDLQREGSQPQCRLTYIIPIREDQQLEVVYELRYLPGSHTAQLICLSHQVCIITTGEDLGGDFLELWPGPDEGDGLAAPDTIKSGG